MGWSKAIADALQTSWSKTRGEPVGELGENQTRGGGLPLGPLVPIHPDLRRIREVRADLDEGQPELGVGNVEVVDGDPPVLLDEGVVGGGTTSAAFDGA